MSPLSGTPESLIEVTRIKWIITKEGCSWLWNKFTSLGEIYDGATAEYPATNLHVTEEE